LNYRHAFHAGNAGDVVKHVVLVALLQALSRKAAPWCYLDSHAGAGAYDLAGAAAQRTGEWRAGIGALWDWTDPPPGPVADYLALVRAAQPSPALATYPGSPALARALARPQDRLVLCELEPDACGALRAHFRGDAQVAVHRRDGYEAAGALLPPRERRGLTLLDPPYESTREPAVAAHAIGRALARFGSGCVALWYPLVSAAEAAGLRRRVRGAADSAPVLDAWVMTRDVAAGRGLSGAGVLVVNPPYRLEAVLQPALATLAARLGGPGARAGVAALAPPAAAGPGQRTLSSSRAIPARGQARAPRGSVR
jgi:23S rRNA (adenine2030-N6)-methyltransferase